MKKEYSNVFSKMILHHNEEVVPFLKELKAPLIKIRRIRILKRLEEIEKEERNYVYEDHLYTYLLMNRFIIQLLPKTEYKNCLELIRNKDRENILIGAYALYELIESKKIEILERLKDEKITIL